MRIGLGGIGKGYAVDYLFEKLKARGLENFFVNGSGDIRVHASNDGGLNVRPWRIGIRNPFNNDPEVSVGFLQIANGASVTVFSDKAIVCDTTATIIMILGIDEGIEKYLNKLKLAGMLIAQSGKVYHSNKSISAIKNKYNEIGVP